MYKIYISITAVFMALVSYCQESIVTGVVTDFQTGEPLPSVSVYQKGTSINTITSLEGEYKIKVVETPVLLEFSFLGYKTQAIKVSSNLVLNIQLEPITNDLNEVVVTALGLKRDSKDLGYALQKIEAKQLSEVKSPNFIDNLAGLAAGVSVSQGASGVGSSSKITIRGEASFSNNNPLFVVDGIPINNNSELNFTSEAAAGFQEVDFGNGGMELTADDIASVSVLKGPAAAALYGTRASNGVIIINTKDGSNSRGLGVSINSSSFVESPFTLPKFQNTYGQGQSGEFAFVDGLSSGVNDNITYSWGPQLDAGNLTTQFDGPVTLPDGTSVRGGDVAVHGGLPITPTELISHPNNLKDFYETGFTTINNIAISNSNNKGSFRLSFTDLRSKSFIPHVNLNRTSANARLKFTPVDKLHISASLNFVNSSSDNRPSSGYGSENINYSLVAWGPRSLNISALENYWQPGLENIQQFSFNYTFFDNPYFILSENTNSFNRNRFFGNLMLDYEFSKRLSLNVMSGMDYSGENREFKRAYSTNRLKTGAYAQQDVGYLERNTNFLVTYKKKLGYVYSEFSVGANRMNQVASSDQTQTLTLAQPSTYNFSNAASPIEAFQQLGQKRINSMYGLAKFRYKNFLFIDISARNDWSSALATPVSAANTSFFYPSLSASYILSQTVNLPKIFSFAKLRASWAQVGNDTDPYRTRGAFIAQTPFNSQPTFSGQNVIPNDELLPEKTTAIELGGDIRFLEDRVALDVTYYNALTENQIISLPVSITSGYSEQVVNGGAVRSKGLELILGVKLIHKESFKWNTQFNFSRNRATVESLPEESGAITLAYSRIYDNPNQTVYFQVEEGGRIGDMYGTGYLKNENGDFILDPETFNYQSDNTLMKLGNYNPDFRLGWNNNFNLNSWNLGFLFDLSYGGELVSRTLALAGVGGQLAETEFRPEEGLVAEGVINVGTDDEPVWEENTTAIPAETYYRTYYDRNHEENNTYSASYLKLRQFSIGFTFKGKKDAGFMKDGNEFSVSLVGRNLFAFSEIPHFDPEQLAVQGNSFVRGVEDVSYPSARSIGLKLGYNF